MIRLIEARDFPNAADVIRRSFAPIAKEFGITKQTYPHHTSFITAEKLRVHFEQGYLMYGLYSKDSMIGYVSLSKEDDNAFTMHNLSVLPEYRSNGRGKALVDFCKSKVKELGGEKITISIIKENAILKDWYIQNGFVYTGTRVFEHLPFTVGYMEWTYEIGNSLRQH